VVFLLAAIGCTVLTVAFPVTFPDSWPSSSPMVPTALLILLTALVNLKVWKDRSFRPQLGRE